MPSRPASMGDGPAHPPPRSQCPLGELVDPLRQPAGRQHRPPVRRPYLCPSVGLARWSPPSHRTKVCGRLGRLPPSSRRARTSRRRGEPIGHTAPTPTSRGIADSRHGPAGSIRCMTLAACCRPRWRAGDHGASAGQRLALASMRMSTTVTWRRCEKDEGRRSRKRHPGSRRPFVSPNLASAARSR